MVPKSQLLQAILTNFQNDVPAGELTPEKVGAFLKQIANFSGASILELPTEVLTEDDIGKFVAVVEDKAVVLPGELLGDPEEFFPSAYAVGILQDVQEGVAFVLCSQILAIPPSEPIEEGQIVVPSSPATVKAVSEETDYALGRALNSSETLVLVAFLDASAGMVVEPEIGIGYKHKAVVTDQEPLEYSEDAQVLFAFSMPPNIEVGDEIHLDWITVRSSENAVTDIYMMLGDPEDINNARILQQLERSDGDIFESNRYRFFKLTDGLLCNDLTQGDNQNIHFDFYNVGTKVEPIQEGDQIFVAFQLNDENGSIELKVARLMVL